MSSHPDLDRLWDAAYDAAFPLTITPIYVGESTRPSAFRLAITLPEGERVEQAASVDDAARWLMRSLIDDAPAVPDAVAAAS